MLEEVLEKSLLVLPEAVREMTEARSKIQAMQDQVDDLTVMVSGLKEQKRDDEKNLA